MANRWFLLALLLLGFATNGGQVIGQEVYINFQPAASEVPAGYLVDSGAVFGDRGNGFSYGWNKDINADFRDRNSANSPDQRWDTITHLQKSGDAIWEIALNNGTYNLLIVAGDPSNTDSTNSFDVEGVLLIDPNGLTGNFDKYTTTVKVADGRLTLKPTTGSSNAKLCFIDIVPDLSATQASEPMPESEASDVIRDTVLSWKNAIYAAKHNVYLGSSFDEVDTATVAIASGLDVNSFDPGRLEFGQTYFWRVDEVNGTPDKTVYKGKVWSFSVEPYSIQIPGSSITVTASSVSNEFSIPENTVNGSGLAANGTHDISAESMWFTETGDLEPWIQFDFDDVQKLDAMKVWNSNGSAEMAIGWGVKGVEIQYSVDGENWDVLADVNQFSRAPGNTAYNQYDEISFGGVAAKSVRFNIQSNWGGVILSYSLSEVQFFMIPTAARMPVPASGAVDVLPNAVVTWRAGRDAGQHMVYVDSDVNAVTDGLVDSVSSNVNSLDLSLFDLTLGETYYWRVDEVNDAQATPVWTGPVWSLSLPESLIVDDFESYTNDSPHKIFQTWIDGYGYTTPEPGMPGNGTGSAVGHDNWTPSSPYYGGDFVEVSIVQGGKQSMPFYYDNTNGPISQIDRVFAEPQDWTLGGAKTLSIAFRGQAGNAGTLYVKINNTKVTYQLDASNIASPLWQAWNIDLAKVNTTLNSVTKMSIGIEGTGSGLLFLDEIRLYAKAGVVLTPVVPDNTGLLAQYSFEGNANDSSGNKLNGALVTGTGTAQIASPGAQNQGSAAQLTLGGYVDLGNPAALDFGTGDWTVAAWFKTTMSGTGDANKGTIVGKGGDSGGGHRYALIMGEAFSGRVSLICDDDVTKLETHSLSLTNDDQWHCAVGQREGTEVRLYIDGQLEVTNTTTKATNQPYSLSGTTQHNAYIGALTNHGTLALYKYFVGSLDEVSFYGRALSEEEILWLSGRRTPMEKPF